MSPDRLDDSGTTSWSPAPGPPCQVGFWPVVVPWLVTASSFGLLWAVGQVVEVIKAVVVPAVGLRSADDGPEAADAAMTAKKAADA
ncbi:hypothetical protein [Streptomyces sp. PTD5-9]|uniref:hypothetical protein n=1 Tax=Streptomyces sp. PTD5-9 TaxID=3120150 RepID=UPI003009F909